MDLYEAVETICKDYCKYPDIESGNKLADICDKCPMNKCEDLRWAEQTEPTTQTETQKSNLSFEKVMEEIQTQVIEFPDTHQKFVFARKIEIDGDSIKICGWEYKGVKDGEREGE